jgi:hypothetical protein
LLRPEKEPAGRARVALPMRHEPALAPHAARRLWRSKRLLATPAALEREFGSRKFVYPPEMMKPPRRFFEARIAERLPGARVLYFT